MGSSDSNYLQMNISVMDNGANLVGFLRMDGAWLGSVDIAMKKVGRLNIEFLNMRTSP